MSSYKISVVKSSDGEIFHAETHNHNLIEIQSSISIEKQKILQIESDLVN